MFENVTSPAIEAQFGNRFLTGAALTEKELPPIRLYGTTGSLAGRGLVLTGVVPIVTRAAYKEPVP